jgi:hypothetical protein
LTISPNYENILPIQSGVVAVMASKETSTVCGYVAIIMNVMSLKSAFMSESQMIASSFFSIINVNIRAGSRCGFPL